MFRKVLVLLIICYALNNQAMMLIPENETMEKQAGTVFAEFQNRKYSETVTKSKEVKDQSACGVAAILLGKLADGFLTKTEKWKEISFEEENGSVLVYLSVTFNQLITKLLTSGELGDAIVWMDVESQLAKYSKLAGSYLSQHKYMYQSILENAKLAKMFFGT